MKLAFCLFNYFPYGGLERNFLKIIMECLVRGHSVNVFTMSWEGENPTKATVTLVPYRGQSNHRQVASYAANLSKFLKRTSYDLIMGFNRIPGLDLYYAADVCYTARIQKERSFLSRFTPRYRLFSAFERAVFSKDSPTEIIILAEKGKTICQSLYGTPENRFHLAPPGVSKNHIRSSLGAEGRKKIREKIGLAKDDNFLLMIGSHFHTKGVDRSIKALASLPLSLRKSTYLFIIGRGKEKQYHNLAQRLGISGNVRFLGVRDDVPLFLAGADFVLQPSRTENTGNPIVEALVAGIPVMATESCGYAFHVDRAQAGMIVADFPFSQKRMNTMLEEMIVSPKREMWRENALSYADRTDLYNRVKVIADLIETVAAKQKVMAKDS
jgi:UDP-glucose:(heptosyl)LPS alpha-1,3-glucosyltransferase